LFFFFPAQSPNAVEVVPVFISIDPKRDTTARLQEYKKQWNPKMLWLTGNFTQVEDVAKKFRVYYSAPDVKEGEDQDYLVDHSIFFYLMDKRGDFMEYFGKWMSAEEVANKMRQTISADA
jgi:protein SCO1/2